MRETNTTSAGTRSASGLKMAPQAIREIADKGNAQAKESYEKMTAASAEASNGVRNAYSTAAQGAMACHAKVIEFARANSNAGFDYASKLLGVKSPSEFIEVSIEHARERLEVLSEQTKELMMLSQKTMLETTEPLKAGAAKVFRGAFA